MAKKEELQKVRVVYVKDPALTVTGITELETAISVKDDLKVKYPEPDFRVRNRYRNRTDMWDVLVKRRTEVKEPVPPTKAEKERAAHDAMVGAHALTGE
jgi:hypothetical protein